MHPAGSVVLFTTMTGFGYGLVVWVSLWILGLGNLFSPFSLIALALALVLICGGLLSSTLHLGHPERAWRAMSQWRTSWLSREGLLAVISLAIITCLMLCLWFGIDGVPLSAMAMACIALSLATVYATAMIYASLKPIPAWANALTILGYLFYALSSGGVLWWFLLVYFIPVSFSPMPIIVVLLVACIVKIGWFMRLARPGLSSIQTALGITGKVASIRQLDPPHSAANYLMKEMGFVIARRHAQLLRIVVFVGMFALPGLIIGLNESPAGAMIAVIASSIGVIAERYLFFAEAKHVVSLYYQSR